VEFLVKHYANEEQQRSDGKYDEQHHASTLVLGRSVAVWRTTP